MTVKKNVIILTDYPDPVSLIRIYGPYKVAHDLRQLGLEVTVVNFLHMWSYEELLDYLDRLINEHTLFVGFSTFFYKSVEGVDVYGDQQMHFKPILSGTLLPHGVEASRHFRQWLKDRGQTLVLGGSTGLDMKENSVYDYVFNGFSETSVINFIDHLTNHTPLANAYRSIHGFTMVNDTNVAENYNFGKSLFKWHDDDCVMPGEVLNIEVARGCIFKCNFCSFPLIGKKKFDHIRDFDILKNEFIDNYERFGTTRYFFSDETFNDSVEKVQLIHRVSQELPFDLEYFAYLRLDLMDRNPESVKLLYESGLRYTHLGVETLNPQASKHIGKSFTFEKAKRAIDSIKQITNNEVNLHASFIIGLPHDTEASIRETYEHIKNKQIALDSFYFMTLVIPRPPFPMSDFGRNYLAYGYEELSADDPVWGADVRRLLNSHFQTFPTVIWQRRDTGMNFVTAERLEHELNSGSTDFKKLGHNAALGIAGLNVPPEVWKDKCYSEIDWPAIAQIKQQRAQLYKSMMWRRFDV